MARGPGEPGQGIYKTRNGQPLVAQYAGDQYLRSAANKAKVNQQMSQYGISNPSYRDQLDWFGTFINNEGGGGAPPRGPTPSYRPPVTSGGGGGGGRGGGGGGGGASPLSQSAIDWATGLSAGMRPRGQTATTYTPPTYGNYTPAAFDATTFNDLRNRLTTAGQTDAATAQGATNAMDAYLKANYTNAFGGLPQQAQMGDNAGALSRLLSGQGVDPSAMSGALQGQAAANQGFQNLWSTLGANENRNQQNALTTNQMTGNDVQNRLRAALMGANTGIDMQQGAAKTAYDQRMEDMRRQDWQTQQELAQQASLANWQRGNTVGDQNVSSQQSFDNQLLQFWLGLMGQTGDATLPTAAQLGIPMV